MFRDELQRFSGPIDLLGLTLILCLALPRPGVAVGVTIDASTVTPRAIIAGQVVEGGTAQLLDLAPGTYQVQLAPGGFPGAITIGGDGSVAYDPALEGSVYLGQGTGTLFIVGHPVSVDATDLSGIALVTGLPGPGSGQVVSYGLPPGAYGIQVVPGGVLPISFVVGADGKVGYEPSLEGNVLTGAGTGAVALVGHAITVSSTQLEGAVLVSGLSSPLPDQTITYRLPIGLFRLQAIPGGLLDLAEPDLTFEVLADGSVDYPIQFDGTALIGRGTNTLEVLPFHVTVDAVGSSSDVNLNFTLFLSAGTTDTFSLSVGTFNVNTNSDGNIGFFTVRSDGACSATEFPFSGGNVFLTCSGACSDVDGDGFGAPGSPSCPAGEITDCNDSNAAVFPGAIELPGNVVDENCDGSLGACDPFAAWKNHGQYVRCVAHEVNDLIDAGLITEDEGDELVKAAAQSDVGK